MSDIIPKKSSYLEITDNDNKYTDITSEFNNYDILINQYFSRFVKYFNKLQLLDYTKDTIKSGQDIIKHGSNLVISLKNHIKSIETLLSDCSDFVDIITEDLSKERPVGDYVYHTTNGILSFPGRDFIIKKVTNPSTKRHTSQKTQTKQTNIPITTNIKSIGYNIKIQHIDDISKLPPVIYYVKSPNPGFYMRLLNDNIVRIPFPEIVDSKKEYERKQSVRCKYNSKEECNFQRQKMANIYKSSLRTCSFAHTGDSIVKVGYPARCPSVPNFGNPTTMSRDINFVTLNDIKNMLMYGLNDIMTAIVWLDYNNINKHMFDELDIA